MLEIDMEFRKGILFVRLHGELTKDTVHVLNEEVTRVIQDYQIIHVVFNIEELTAIDQAGCTALYHNYQITTKNNGNVLVCGVKDRDIKKTIEQHHLLEFMYETSDELTALEQVHL